MVRVPRGYALPFVRRRLAWPAPWSELPCGRIQTAAGVSGGGQPGGRVWGEREERPPRFPLVSELAWTHARVLAWKLSSRAPHARGRSRVLHACAFSMKSY